MTRNIYVLITLLLLAALSYAQPFSQSGKAPDEAKVTVTLPNIESSVKFLATGDTGRGTPVQFELGRVMADYQKIFPFDTALLTGDNLYGPETPSDYRAKFEEPYRELLDRDVKFYATLGNHDETPQIHYEHFNMGGKEYYRFEKGDVAFYALDTTYLKKDQIDWLESELADDDSRWKMAFFHHPPFSSGGRHGSDDDIRDVLHPIFVKYGVDVVFTGHDHFYERIKPQDGVQYFVTGAGGEVRRNDIKNRGLTAKGYDQDLSFMLVEVIGDAMIFQAVSRSGATVDSGVVIRQPDKKEAKK
ncbi:MAG TPA: metallophosphoesterase [Pyrinomonadaceae bacterium]|nr:metallophosphoesterase [Pyrinomonadaceae bacterium]